MSGETFDGKKAAELKFVNCSVRSRSSRPRR